MRNRYLSDRASRRMGMSRDGRNPYGSRGGYVMSSRGRGRDRAMEDMARGNRGSMRGNDRGMDYNYPMSESDSRYDYRRNSYDRGSDYHMGSEYPREHSRPMQYELYGIGGMRPRMDYNYDYGYDYGYDYRGGRDYGEDMEKEYEEKLHKWIEKLKKHDRFSWNKEQVIQRAKAMNVKFDEFDENEFYATYLMIMSDFKQVANDPNMYIALAKDWLMDDDVALKGSDKLCSYLYVIVLGEDE